MTGADSVMGDPSPEGRFGDFGGRFVPETLVPACQQLEAAFREAWADPAFRTELDDLLRDYAGRPSPLLRRKNVSFAPAGMMRPPSKRRAPEASARMSSVVQPPSGTGDT